MDASIGNAYLDLLKTIAEADDVTFSKLVVLAGLDPKVDFRWSNLRKVDFQDADIRGFDFTCADLTGAVKNSRTIIDETTIFDGASVAWIEAETPDIIKKMLLIQNATSTTQRRRLLIELQENYRSTRHVRQFLLTSIKMSHSIEAFFDFCSAITAQDDENANAVILEELRRLVNSKGTSRSKGPRKLAQTPYGTDLICRLLESSINPQLIAVAKTLFVGDRPINNSMILDAIGMAPKTLV